MKYILVLLFPVLLYSQQEYKYDLNKSNLPTWVKEMYKLNPNPAKVESFFAEVKTFAPIPIVTLSKILIFW